MALKSKKYGNFRFKGNSLRDELEKYLRHWPWFLLCIIVAIAGGYFYLRYSTPVYRANASIIINEENKEDGGVGAAAFNNLALINGMGTNSIKKELAILKSRRLMKEVVDALNLNISFYKEGQVREVELYNSLPFSFQVLKLDESKRSNYGGGDLKIQGLDTDKIKVTFLESGKTLIASAGSPVSLGFAEVVITKKKEIRKFPEVLVRFSKMEEVAARYKGKIQILEVDRNSPVIELSLDDPVKEKARDILDQLIFEFNKDAIEDKNLIAGNTAKFINERLDIINNELESVETGKEEFKESHRLTDIQTESQMYVQNASDYNQRRQEIGTQIELAGAMLDYLFSNSNDDLLPANLGIEENAINNQIGEYNNLILEKNRILRSSTDKNPVVVRLNSRIDQIRNNITQSLQRLVNNLQISQDDINRQYSSIGARIMAVPSQEREYRGIERQQGIKEALYLFLLQKREENSLALAITAPKAKIVDRAYNIAGIVSPNSRSIYLGSVLLGLFIPFSIIYGRGLFNNKITSKSDIDRIDEDLYFLGELPKVNKKESIIERNDRSVLAESFRILTTNMEYLLVNCLKREEAVKILVTSTIKGEGKTFTSVNLAITLANHQKRVLLIGADLRNPKLNSLVDKRNNLGVSDYLSNPHICVKSLIEKSNLHPEIDILPSGNIPPNPNELLKTERTESMFQELKYDYDYIIVDTAPSMLVADTFSITKFADLILYVIRAGYTEKKLIEFVVDAKKTGSIKNVGLILNNVASTNLAYGSKYGYGYGMDKPKFWGREPKKSSKALVHD